MTMVELTPLGSDLAVRFMAELDTHTKELRIQWRPSTWMSFAAISLLALVGFLRVLAYVFTGEVAIPDQEFLVGLNERLLDSGWHSPVIQLSASLAAGGRT